MVRTAVGKMTSTYQKTSVRKTPLNFLFLKFLWLAFHTFNFIVFQYPETQNSDFCVPTMSSVHKDL